MLRKFIAIIADSVLIKHALDDGPIFNHHIIWDGSDTCDLNKYALGHDQALEI